MTEYHMLLLFMYPAHYIFIPPVLGVSNLVLYLFAVVPVPGTFFQVLIPGHCISRCKWAQMVLGKELCQAKSSWHSTSQQCHEKHFMAESITAHPWTCMRAEHQLHACQCHSTYYIGNFPYLWGVPVPLGIFCTSQKFPKWIFGLTVLDSSTCVCNTSVS